MSETLHYRIIYEAQILRAGRGSSISGSTVEGFTPAYPAEPGQTVADIEALPEKYLGDKVKEFIWNTPRLAKACITSIRFAVYIDDGKKPPRLPPEEPQTAKKVARPKAKRKS